MGEVRASMIAKCLSAWNADIKLVEYLHIISMEHRWKYGDVFNCDYESDGIRYSYCN